MLYDFQNPRRIFHCVIFSFSLSFYLCQVTLIMQCNKHRRDIILPNNCLTGSARCYVVLCVPYKVSLYFPAEDTRTQLREITGHEIWFALDLCSGLSCTKHHKFHFFSRRNHIKSKRTKLWVPTLRTFVSWPTEQKTRSSSFTVT